jgi:hypothetical protein
MILAQSATTKYKGLTKRISVDEMAEEAGG